MPYFCMAGVPNLNILDEKKSVLFFSLPEIKLRLFTTPPPELILAATLFHAIQRAFLRPHLQAL